MKRLFELVLLLAIACAKREPLPSPPPAITPFSVTIPDTAERASLCDMAHGATVVSRTGEALLETSALHAVDGDPGTFWMTPMHDVPQSMAIALPARARIDKVGIRTVSKAGFTANHIDFETSTDGAAFSKLTSIKSAFTDDAQWFDVTPAEASHIRVTIADTSTPDHDVRLYSVLVHGTESEPSHAGDITGCWSINGQQARFERRGSHVVGILQTGKEPMRFDGAFDGRIYRLSWIRGNDYGMTLLDVSPDGQHLSAANWHEEAIPMFFDTSWFGERNKCTLPIPDSTELATALLRRTGRYSLYGRSEVLPLLKAFPVYRFVGHEFRFPTAKENHDAAQRALVVLRQQLTAAGVKLDGVECITQGSETPRQNPVTEAMRALYSTIDLEIRR